MAGLWGTGGSVRISAHRGVHSGGVSENSLRALELGAAMGVGSVETDVRRTADGVLVIHHDPDVADGREIADLRYDELPPLADGQHIPTLTEYAARASELGQHLTVEIKEGGYEREIVDQLTAAMPDGRFELTSFSPLSIRAVEQYDSSVRTGMFGMRLPGKLRDGIVGDIVYGALNLLGMHPSIPLATWAGADYISDLPIVVDERYVTDAHQHGLRIMSATANPDTMQRLLDAGIDGLLTDRPDLALGLTGGSMSHESI